MPVPVPFPLAALGTGVRLGTGARRRRSRLRKKWVGPAVMFTCPSLSQVRLKLRWLASLPSGTKVHRGIADDDVSGVVPPADWLLCREHNQC